MARAAAAMQRCDDQRGKRCNWHAAAASRDSKLRDAFALAGFVAGVSSLQEDVAKVRVIVRTNGSLPLDWSTGGAFV